ncbi:MAG: zinc-ribbon domain-containing protein [Clostridiales bacterium]|nr:zinc-ribbon domain-containing protein [Clostridiales bacterium]
MRSFLEIHPNLVSEWSPVNELGPDQVSYGSNKPIIWNGVCGHTWTATPKNRGNNHGCPYCSSNKILVGVNDLASRHPELAKEWSGKNLPAMPQQYGEFSNKPFWWKCSKCGNEWLARIADRSEGHGCPFCVAKSREERWQERRNAKQELLATRRREHLIQVRQQQLTRDLKDSGFRIAVIRYYSALTGFSVVYDQVGHIGIPLQIFFPEKCAAIELTSHLREGWRDWRYENAKNWLCLNSGIKLIRIIPQTGYKFENCKCVRLKNDSVDALNYTLTQVFKRLKIPMDIDVSRDYEKIRRYLAC